MPFSPHPDEPAPDSPIAALHTQPLPGTQPNLPSAPTRSLSFSQMPQPSTLAQPSFAPGSARLPNGRPGLDMSRLGPHSANQSGPGSHALPGSHLPFSNANADGQSDMVPQQLYADHANARGQSVMLSEQQNLGSHEQVESVPEVLVSQQSISSQISELSAAEQGGAFPSRWGLPQGVTSPVIRAGRLRPSSDSAQGDHPWLQVQRRQENDGGGDEVTYDLGPPTRASSGVSELSQIDEGRVGSEGLQSEERASWGGHGPGAMRSDHPHRSGQWTSPVVQNPLFAGGSCHEGRSRPVSLPMIGRP